MTVAHSAWGEWAWGSLGWMTDFCHTQFRGLRYNCRRISGNLEPCYRLDEGKGSRRNDSMAESSRGRGSAVAASPLHRGPGGTRGLGAERWRVLP